MAKALLNEKTAAEDVVRDVFVSFAESIEKFQFTGSLRGYLATCVGNLARDRIRAKKQRTGNPDLKTRETSRVGGYYQPLTMISLMTDYTMGGRAGNLLPFHRTSLVLHAVNTTPTSVKTNSTFSND